MTTKAARLAPQCTMCRRADIASGKCKAIAVPQAMFTEALCWAYTLDPDWERKAEQATARYARTLRQAAMHKGSA